MAKKYVDNGREATAEEKQKMEEARSRNQQQGQNQDQATTQSSDSNTQNGMLNWKGMMDDFFSSSPDDVAGRLQKDSFKGDFLQSAIDSQLAMQLGQFNSGLAQNNMTHQADLEQRNQSATMRDEFMYGMESMDAQFQYQNNFANAQHDRDLGMVSATGEQDRLAISAQGQQDRLGTIVTGEQQRLTDAQNNVSNEKR